ncbi:MAG: phosphoribosylglycinamide formyltransferase [bacterium]|nr:phosphoribosylglycinamide formyltransferase [bacterium]
MPERGRVGILISGRGSNMISLVEAMQRGDVPADPVLVLSNVPSAQGLERAAEMGVPTAVVEHRRIKPREAHEREVVRVLQQHRVDLVCLAGYMRLLSPLMVEAFRNRMLNIHPSLLPAFPGLHAQRQALDHGVKLAGCTVHLVDEQCDHGPIVLQAAVPVVAGDTEESLSARILEQEHAIYPEAVRMFFDGKFRVDGRHASVEA